MDIANFSLFTSEKEKKSYTKIDIQNIPRITAKLILQEQLTYL